MQKFDDEIDEFLRKNKIKSDERITCPNGDVYLKTLLRKFAIDHYDFTLEMPKDAEILTVQTQNEKPCIWALVNPENDKELRYFEVYGTGHGIHYDMGIERKYINTFQLDDGSLVFHLFERIN
jgi:hypothetical protein